MADVVSTLDTPTIRPVSVRVAYVLLASTIVIGAFAFTLVKSALEQMTSLDLATGRVVVSAVFFLVVLANQRLRTPASMRAPSDVRRGDRLRIMCIGLAGSIGFHLIGTWGMEHSSIAVAAVIMATMPAMTAGGEVAFLHHRLTRRHLVGIVLAVAGCCIVGVSGGGDGETTLLGVGALVLATALWAGLTVATRGIGDRYDSYWINTPGTVVGALMMLALDASSLHHFAHLSLRTWLVVLWLGAAGSAYYYVAMAKAMTAISATTAASLSTVVTPASVLVGWLVLGDAPTSLVVGGGAVVIVGALLIVNEP